MPNDYNHMLDGGNTIPWPPNSTPWPNPINPPVIPWPQIEPAQRPRVRVIREKVSRVNTRAKKETYITLLLDKSGSMQTCYDAALDAINEQIKTIRKNAKKGGKTFVTLILFSSEVQVVYENVPAEKIARLTKAEYVLDGFTALRDAVLTGIEVMSEYVDVEKNQGFLSVLISDGQENQSGTSAQALKDRITELQKTDKWTFTYMLSGHSWQDVQDVSSWSNTAVGNIASYTATGAGYAVASKGMSAGIGNYLTARDVGETKTDCFYQGDTDLTIKQ